MDALFFLMLVVILAVGLLPVWLYVKKEYLYLDGKNAERKTAAILSKFAFLRGFKVLSGEKVKVKDKSVEIENMLIGYFGILIVKTLGAAGKYYGELSDEKWILVKQKNDERVSIPNPMLILQEQKAALHAALAKEDVYNIPIEYIVYFSSKSSKTSIFVGHNGEIISAGKLSAYLNKTKFEKDTGLDIAQITAVIANKCN